MDGQVSAAASQPYARMERVPPVPAVSQHWGLIGLIAAVVFLDFASIAMSGQLIGWWYVGSGQGGQRSNASILIGLISVILFCFTGAYHRAILIASRRFVATRLVVLLCVWSAMLVIVFGLKLGQEVSRFWLFSWLLVSSLLIILIGINLPILARHPQMRAWLQSRYVHIVTSRTADCTINQSALDRSCVLIRKTLSSSVDDALACVRDEIFLGNNMVVSAAGEEMQALMHGLAKFRLSGVDILLDLSSINPLAGSSDAGSMRLPLFHIIRKPMNDYDIAFKRLMDVVIAGVALILLSPAFAVISALILIEDGRPIYFLQPRTGYRHDVFGVWKFRTMRADASDIGAVRQTYAGDERITKVGRILRKCSLDEIPQLFNVLRGEMSLVGPRPHALEMSVNGTPVTKLVSNYASRHSIKPGMTGLAQVRGFRGPVHDLEHLQYRVESDVEYIERWKPTLDLWILWKTVLIVLRDGLSFNRRRELRPL